LVFCFSLYFCFFVSHPHFNGLSPKNRHYSVGFVTNLSLKSVNFIIGVEIVFMKLSTFQFMK